MLLRLLDRPIAYHRILAEIAGSVGGGVFLSQCIYWTKRTTLPDGWFYKTADEWYDETYLTRREQETIRKRLVSINILKEEKRGVPAKLHYKINVSAIEKYTLIHLDTLRHTDVNEDVQASFDKSAKLGSPETPNLLQQKRQSNTETTSETTAETTEVYISAQSEFDQFWEAYPKRPNNPRKKAMAAYLKARKNVSQKQLLEAVGLYAAYMAGEDPKFIAMASTWLNDERWNCDYSKAAKVIQSYNDVKYSSDDELDAIVAKYPGVVSDRATARKALAAELSKGVALDDIVKAAEKFKLYIKQAQQSGTLMAAPILETWIKFKWREMDAYYIYRNPVERYPVLKPVKVKT